MINNLDNPALLENALRRVDKYGKWYVDYMSNDRSGYVVCLEIRNNY